MPSDVGPVAEPLLRTGLTAAAAEGCRGPHPDRRRKSLNGCASTNRRHATVGRAVAQNGCRWLMAHVPNRF